MFSSGESNTYTQVIEDTQLFIKTSTKKKRSMDHDDALRLYFTA